MQHNNIIVNDTMAEFSANSKCVDGRISSKVYHFNFIFHHNVSDKVFLSEQKGITTFISPSFSIP